MKDDLDWAVDQGLPQRLDDGGNGADNRPAVYVSGQHMHEITSASVRALEAANEVDRFLFCRGNSLVRLQVGESGASAEALTPASLRGILDRSANFLRYTEKGDLPARPPGDVVADILRLPKLPFPGLRGFSESPVFLPNGNVLQESGYNDESGIYVHLNGLNGRIRTDMPLPDARTLLLEELLGDFPLSDNGSRSHALAMILQPFVRYMIDGPTPLILVDAPSRGTGKGLLVDVTAVITLGRPATVMVLPKDEDELDKRITATLVEGYPMILLDNLTSLKSGTLSAALTTTLWRGRWLGKSKMVDAPNFATWIATGNNVIFSDEMVRRTVHIRLDAGVERPEERTGFRHPDLMAWVRENRCMLVSACLSIIQAWIVQGKPKGKGTLGRFERWVEVVGGILDVVGVEGFLSNRESLYADADADTQEWTMLCREWWARFQDRPITAKDLLVIAKDNQLIMDRWAGRSELPGTQRIGYALKARRDRVFGGYRIRNAGNYSETKSVAYRLEKVGAIQPPQTPVSTNSTSESTVDPQGVSDPNPSETPVAKGQDPPERLGTNPGVYGVSGVSSEPPANDSTPCTCPTIFSRAIPANTCEECSKSFRCRECGGCRICWTKTEVSQ